MAVSQRPFDHVVTEHGGVVLSVLRGVVGSADADDCWQETFIAALRAYPQLRPGSNVRGWLVTIAHRKAVDALRARSRRAVSVAEPEPTDTWSAESSSQTDAVLDGMVTAALWARVGSLPEKQRLAVAYRFGADLDYEEIAVLIGCSRDAARRSVFEGVRRLRRHSSEITSEITSEGES